ncbi:FMN-dependent NADH-azoreductase [Actinokineospora iranica]|uniref:FMN dependent NADH:quinone oxidoreductase n=1 Tax=Actinokineospora iranica TaxID=1271860 RepID=A0A1G6UX21_9PSEU|nr:NAD(P)H-dependent oxidoreductase [Actinokineospora iranica]SDD45920.1 FMN-dependent NADH-azoreductase [Actinokineospora iranica]
MTLLRVDSSIRTEGSVSRAVADTLENTWRAEHPTGAVVRRDLGVNPLPADTWANSVAAGYAAEPDAEQQAAAALATELADEVLAADAVVIATSLYNFGLSQHLKNWIDLLISEPRLGPGSTALQGRPVAIVVARGGGYGAGTPREGWDHATPYLVRIFQDVYGAEVTVVEAELTMAESVPAMADLVPLAKESVSAAHSLAASTAKVFVSRSAA